MDIYGSIVEFAASGPPFAVATILRTDGSTPAKAGGKAIIDGTAGSLSGIMVITASGVVLNGLEVRNGSGDLIDSESSIPTSGTVIQYCIIHDSSGDEGIQLRNVADDKGCSLPSPMRKESIMVLGKGVVGEALGGHTNHTNHSTCISDRRCRIRGQSPSGGTPRQEQPCRRI